MQYNYPVEFICSSLRDLGDKNKHTCVIKKKFIATFFYINICNNFILLPHTHSFFFGSLLNSVTGYW